MITGMRSCNAATISLARVVTIVNVLSHAPVSGFFQISHKPARVKGEPSAEELAAVAQRASEAGVEQ